MYKLHPEIKIIRSGRKTLSIEITPTGEVLVRAPYRVPMTEIERVIEAKREWIERRLRERHEKQSDAQPPFTSDEIRSLAERAAEIIPPIAEHYARTLGESYGRITIRAQKTRWGSCSSKGSLSFNCLLMLAPPEVLKAVVAHEICHLRHMNHSADFYDELLRLCPDYYTHHNWLRENGLSLLARLP